MRKIVKKTKKSSETSIKTHSNISWNMKPPNPEAISQQGKAKCKEYDCEIHKLVRLIADIATSIWRMNNKFSAVNIDDMPDEIKKACRHVEAARDTLSSAKVKVLDHTNKKYVAGMALNVIAFQPSSSVHIEMISETIRPSIFYNDKLIQMGEVIVKTPEKTKSKESDNIKNTCEDKGRNTK